MLSTQLAAIALAVLGAGDFNAPGADAHQPTAVLLDFQADWCGPCRSMESTVASLAAAGYPIKKVNIDQQRDLAQQFHVSAIPCFVLVRGGKEVDRIVGPCSADKLKAMFAARPAGGDRMLDADPTGQRFTPSSAAPADLAAPSASSGFIPPSSGAPASAGQAPTSQLMAASVRLTIEDARGFSYGSGTMIDSRQGTVLVLTCGHIFRDSQGQGKITVDVFGANPQSKLVGQLVGYDLKRDIGLVSIRPTGSVVTLPVAPPGYRVRPGDRVVSVGCDNGANPTARASSVNSLDKFLGPANLQVAGEPTQGRSGGGLFAANGLVIGVCNAADPTDHEGLFAAAATIHAQLDQSGLAAVYQNSPIAGIAVAGNATASNSFTAGPAAGSVPDPGPAGGSVASSLPSRMPTPDVRTIGNLVDPAVRAAAATGAVAAASSAADALRQLSPQEKAALSELRQKAQGAEVICIVRSLNDPQAKSEIIVLDRASTMFLNQLSAERSVQDARHLTSLRQPARQQQQPSQQQQKPPQNQKPGWTMPTTVPAANATIAPSNPAPASRHRPTGNRTGAIDRAAPLLAPGESPGPNKNAIHAVSPAFTKPRPA